MKSLKLLLLVFLSNFLIAQTNLNNPQQIGQTTRNQKVGNGFQVEDTLLVKGKVFFKNLSISTDTFINVSDINGKIGKIGKTSLLNSSSQTLSISNDTLTISNGNSVILPIYFQSDSATITSYDVLNSQNAPPISPNTGDTYLVGTSPSGAWVGHAKDIAEWNGSSWDFTDGVQGDFLYNATTALTYIFRSGNWVQTTGIPALNNGNIISSGLKIGTNNARSLTFETNNANRGRFDSIGRFYVYDTSLRKANKYLQIDSITGRLIASDISGGGGGGSGQDSSGLGGILTQNTTINTNSFNFNISHLADGSLNYSAYIFGCQKGLNNYASYNGFEHFVKNQVLKDSCTNYMASLLGYSNNFTGYVKHLEAVYNANTADNYLQIALDKTTSTNLQDKGTVDFGGGNLFQPTPTIMTIKSEVDYTGDLLLVRSQSQNIFGIDNLGKISAELPLFADDASAGVGGLIAGQLYKTDGTGASPLNVIGIVMIKQ